MKTSSKSSPKIGLSRGGRRVEMNVAFTTATGATAMWLWTGEVKNGHYIATKAVVS